MSEKYPPITLPRSEVRVLHSAHVGQDYRLLITLPEEYEESEESFPVLYVTDANFWYEIVLGLTEWTTRIPPMIVVGVSYPEADKPNFGRFRARDFLPTENNETAVGSGGGGRFLSFFREELFPFVDSEYRTKADDRTGFFFSFGGTFGVYTLLTQTDTFKRYILGAPDLSWDNEVCFDYEREYAEKFSDLTARLFLSVGTLDEDFVERNASSLLRFHALLLSRDYGGLKMKLDMLDGETHISALIPTVFNGLRAVFSDAE